MSHKRLSSSGDRRPVARDSEVRQGLLEPTSALHQKSADERVHSKPPIQHDEGSLVSASSVPSAQGVSPAREGLLTVPRFASSRVRAQPRPPCEA